MTNEKDDRTEPTFPQRWAAQLLRGEPGTVAGLVPRGFDGYARILHPAFRETAEGLVQVPWHEVATASSRAFDPGSSSFHDTSGVLLHSGGTGANWDIEPVVGSPDDFTAVSLIRILRQHTNTPHRCCLGVWDGYGGLDLDEFSERLELTGRSYVVAVGPISLAFDVTGTGRGANIWWPASADWCVVSDVDLPATYVGGSERLVTALVEAQGMEAVTVLTDTRVAEPSRME